MTNKLFVANLPFSATEEDLKQFFAAAGSVVSARIITDRETGRSRGFGFVEMSSPEEAQRAMSEFNEKELNGRTIFVSEANDQR